MRDATPVSYSRHTHTGVRASDHVLTISRGTERHLAEGTTLKKFNEFDYGQLLRINELVGLRKKWIFLTFVVNDERKSGIAQVEIEFD